ncbi:MAG: oligosaccharide flippase family protein [Phototrophicaceae bacterium]
MNLESAYQHAQNNRDAGFVLALIGLTGLSQEQCIHAEIHLDENYVRVHDAVYLLSKQASILLSDLTDLHDIDIDEGLRILESTENDLREALSAAIWATFDEGQLLQDMVVLNTLTSLPLELTYPFSVADKIDPNDPARFKHSLATIQAAVDYMLEPSKPIASLLNKLLDGKLVFLVVTTGVSGLNLIHNLLMGRLLSPADYGQLTFVNTILLIISLIPSGMQTVSARYSSIYESQEKDDLMQSLWRFGTRYGWITGVLISFLLFLLAPFFVDWFQLRNVWIVYPIAFGVPFFLATGTERGLLQGTERYYWLSGAYLMEGVIRLGLGVILTLVLTQTNRGLDGAIWALSQSLILTWFVAWLSFYSRSPIRDTLTAERSETLSAERKMWLSLFGYTAMALLGQALITNSDFVLVKTYFDSYDAGLYAAISVIGRIVYFGTLPLTVLIVPIIARQQVQGKSTQKLFFLLMGSGIILCGGLVLASLLFAPLIVETLYGTAYVDAAYLLPMYTVAAALFVLTNLLVTYRVALGKGSETWMPLVAAVAQIIGVIFFHDSLITIIIVQIIIMSVLFMGVAWRARR